MKKQALIVAALLACGSAAFAADDHAAARTDNRDQTVQHESSTGNNLRNGMHRLGDKMRSGMHRLGEKLHAHNDRGNDTRAMGASPSRDHDRQSRMDEAYSHWHAKNDKQAQKDVQR